MDEWIDYLIAQCQRMVKGEQVTQDVNLYLEVMSLCGPVLGEDEEDEYTGECIWCNGTGGDYDSYGHMFRSVCGACGGKGSR